MIKSTGIGGQAQALGGASEPCKLPCTLATHCGVLARDVNYDFLPDISLVHSPILSEYGSEWVGSCPKVPSSIAFWR